MQDSQFKTTEKAEFSAAYRLLREDKFDHVVCAEQVSDRFFKIFFVPNSQGNARLGIIASKKKLSASTQRNRFKRAIREVFRKHEIKTLQLDLVVMVKFADAQKSTHQKELKALLSRVESKCVSS